MNFTQWNTHTIGFGPGEVTKRFRRGHHEECAREWRALTLLAEYAPGTAPTPLRADLDAAEPVVVMSRLNGETLRGRPLREELVQAFSEAVERIHTALPAEVLAEVAPRPWQVATALESVRAGVAELRPRMAPHVARVADEALNRLSYFPVRAPVSQVLGAGDGNLANYLWDGSGVLRVDFEDFGRSDRAFELAEIVEHVGSWVEYPLDVDLFLKGFSLTSAESERLVGCRRLLALGWLLLLCRDAEGVRRNPPGTVDRQAERLAALLD
ncbi:aminoglycoside phosphotransferase family protein [Nocardiopsis alba]|uniref:aminoglycoside phosphotransferase family protein n=1 Tax=Nocardiopsis alba TaxID=53437 RepID=UPI00366FD782